ncbi:hypothetical protein GCM10022226_41990 [Sphaerisporangium flaviroseum]|uniref:Peptidase M28 domain-containing protein n=1 Tax=Sphaerisporangium flaviroseum TaxID=509199 RepID=A0ABP7IF63_9ACTN
MSVKAVAEHLHSSFDTASAMADVAALCEFDRYQASDGIMAAAEYVADRAEKAGLADVRLLRFPADGNRRWWTFRAPSSWTPIRGELSSVAAHPARPFTLAAYPAQPFTLAAHSAPTGPAGVDMPVVRISAADPAPLRGALAVHDDPLLPLPRALALAERHGALGVVTDQVSAEGGIGRVELRAGTPLFAFAVGHGQLADLLARGHAHVTVTARESAPMPVVTAVLPGEEEAETLLCAHLCHPRPSANDNASGVAALLGTAGVLSGTRRRRGIRFVWGPEFTGMAAYLHDVASAPPIAAVNLDMAGEDQRLCGGPLIVERGPDHLPGFVSALAEHVVALIPQAARSYTGAVACDTWAWRATPFVGASDHSLLVDRSVGCPTVTLGHWPDRFNHSSADTLDKVDPGELRRTATIAGATAAVLSAATAADRPELERIATRWAAARLLECLPGQDATGTPAHPRELLRHRTHVALAALAWIDELCGDRGRPEAGRWIEDLSAHIGGLLPGPPPEPAGTPAVVCRTWPGPFNLRGLAEAARPPGREWIDARLAEDRSRGYALMLALAHGIDGTRDHRAVARYAELTSGIPVDPDFARGFLDVLVEAGWARESATTDRGDDAPPHA